MDETVTLVDRIAATANDRKQWTRLGGQLRAVARPLLDAVVTMRHEPIEPYERTLAFAAERVTAGIGDAPVHADPRYLLGRVDALLDLCDAGIDRSVSESVVAEVRVRPRVRAILRHLVQVRQAKAGDLAAAVGIEPNHLSNLLRGMEAKDLVRRAAAGRTTRVSLGPKGEAVHLALGDEDHVSGQPAASGGSRISWLLQFAGQESSVPAAVALSTAPVDLLSARFDELEGAEREEFRLAVAEVAGQWRRADGLDSLLAVARLAVRVGATDVVDALRGHIEQAYIDPGAAEDRDTVATLITIMGDLRAAPQARVALRRFFSDERFHPAFTADLVVALCRSEPARYWLYLPRLLDLGPSPATRQVLTACIDAVGWDLVCSCSHELPREALRQFLEAIGWANVIASIEDVPRDALETFVVRGVTWPLLSQALPTLDSDSRNRLIERLLGSRLLVLDWEGDSCMLRPASLPKDEWPHVAAAFTHKAITRTVYQQTHSVEALYDLVDGLG